MKLMNSLIRHANCDVFVKFCIMLLCKYDVIIMSFIFIPSAHVHCQLPPRALSIYELFLSE